VWGLVDQQATEDRDDVLVYTSDVLTEPLTFAGNIEAKLHVSTNTPDADWVIKLIDVHPNGFAPHVARGILRGRYRHSLLNPELMQPELMQPEQIHHRPGALSRIVLPVLIPEPTR
jgi:predicted acyl esterase